MKRTEIIYWLGKVFAPIYSLVMRIRALLYQYHVIQITRLTIPVISVGNLTMGGTGKTPMVMHLARLFLSSKKPAVISRGYGGRAKGPVNVVADEKQTFLSAVEAGDEPRLLADSLEGVPVLTGSKRAEVGSYAVKEMAVDLLIMDDGFQHMALHRDLDLVLFSASSFLGNGWVCPGGPLREPFSALIRADAFVITGVCENNIKQVDEFKMNLYKHFPAKPLFTGMYKPAGIKKAGFEQSGSLPEEKEVPLFAFCGIATPESFLNSLIGENLDVKGFKTYSDHHNFSEDDLTAIEQEAVAANCRALITTAKDFVKIEKYRCKMPIWILEVTLEMDPDFDKFVLDRVL